MLIPETKIKIDHIQKIKIVCPTSGWRANNNATQRAIKNVNTYFIFILVYFLLLKIKLIKTIKNGFTTSIGWNLGNKYRSIHLFEPFTSIPINGTKIRKINDTKNKIKE